MMLEFKTLVNTIAKDRGIEKEIVKKGIEQAFKKILSERNGHLGSFEVDYDLSSGEISAYQFKKVVEEVVDPNLEVSLKEAKKVTDESGEEVELGETLGFLVEDVNEGIKRVEIQKATQIIMSYINKATRDGLKEKYNCKKDQLLTGTVKVVNDNGYVISFRNEVDGFLSKDQCMPDDKFGRGDIVDTFVLNVHISNKGPDIKLSRKSPLFVYKLLEQEVPDLDDGTIEVVSIAREAGKKTKIALRSNDSEVDPVLACLGHGGHRIQNLTEKLHGENIELMNANVSEYDLVIAAMKPAKLENIQLLEDEVNIVIDDSEPNAMGKAIGSKCFNLRLASTIVGKNLNIIAQSKLKDKVEKSQEELSQVQGVDFITARALVNAGIYSVEELQKCELESVDGVSKLSELVNNAQQLKDYQRAEEVSLVDAHASPRRVKLPTREEKSNEVSRKELESARYQTLDKLGFK